jgi:hypothetical protein
MSARFSGCSSSDAISIAGISPHPTQGLHLPLARKIGTSAYLLNETICEAREECISEADLMTGKDPLSFVRRIERH